MDMPDEKISQEFKLKKKLNKTLFHPGSKTK